MRWLKDPLVHFLLIGAGLFFVYHLVNDSGATRPDRIVVDAGKIEQLATLWSRRWQRPPTAAELEGLIEAYVREEVLYREAAALGLEQDDTIVRRRMAQKMAFLIKDLALQGEPSDAELDDYLQQNADRFREPPRFTFKQVYLSSDRRGEKAVDDAQRLLTDLRAQGASADPSRFGDSFMLGYHFSDLSQREVSRMLGKQFAESLSALGPKQWQGPIESGYGQHLVFIDGFVPARLPRLEEIRDRVSTDLSAERQKKTDQALYEQLRARYEVVIERPQ